MAITTKQVAEMWGISDRRVRILCENGKIEGAFRDGKIWYIPDNVSKPQDARIKSKQTLIEQIEAKKKILYACRPLTDGEVARLNEEFMVE